MSGLESVAAALEQFEFYVQVGRGHNWEKKVAETGVAPDKIAAALNSRGFNIGNARTPVLAIQKAADCVRSAAAAERRKELVHDWRGGSLCRKPRGHICDKDAACPDWYAYRIKTPDGGPILMCAYHHLTDAPQGLHDAYIRKTAGTCYHYAGTCKMGSDSMAVVSPSDLSVIGIEQLRVIDSSVIPQTVSGNTAAATMMIAARDSEMIVSSG